MSRGKRSKSDAQTQREGTLVSGGLLQIYGLGVLIRGDSGIGKSETALELISRGHHFISDDVTLVTKSKGGKIFGSAPDLSRFFMEIRGLGIINIKETFGTRAISHKAEISLVVQMKEWEEGKEYDRLGLKFYEDYQVLGAKIPQINIPVAPGRNMATLIEVASKVHILKSGGYHAPEDLTKKLAKVLTPNKPPTK
jgi:HPr kinase/phosphorylase